MFLASASAFPKKNLSRNTRNIEDFWVGISLDCLTFLTWLLLSPLLFCTILLLIRLVDAVLRSSDTSFIFSISYSLLSVRPKVQHLTSS